MLLRDQITKLETELAAARNLVADYKARHDKMAVTLSALAQGIGMSYPQDIETSSEGDELHKKKMQYYAGTVLAQVSKMPLRGTP